jgi:hypothetical protein
MKTVQKLLRTGGPVTSGRRGAASLDYVLVLGVILPLATFMMTVGPKIIRAAYDMVRILVTWPFL